MTHFFVKQHIVCNIKAVSFTYPLENFTLDHFFYTTSGCDGCDKYEVWGSTSSWRPYCQALRSLRRTAHHQDNLHQDIIAIVSLTIPWSGLKWAKVAGMTVTRCAAVVRSRGAPPTLYCHIQPLPNLVSCSCCKIQPTTPSSPSRSAQVHNWEQDICCTSFSCLSIYTSVNQTEILAPRMTQ